MSDNRTRIWILVVAGLLLIATGILAYNRLIPSLVARSVFLAVPMGCLMGGRLLDRRGTR